MPGRDKTGPMGNGAMTGRGLGLCMAADTVKNAVGLGLAFACRRGRGQGLGRFFNTQQNSPEMQKEFLKQQKEILQSQLEIINKQMENL